MHRKTSLLGIAFLSPTLVLLFCLFLAPAVLTTVFAFTNMSTATGITGGAYTLTPNLLRALEERGLDPEVAKALAQSSLVVNDASLSAAREDGIKPAFLADIKDELYGESFGSARAFEAALKELPSRPRRVRDLKLATEPFSRSVIHQRFETRRAMETAISNKLPEADRQTVATIVDASYTGWRWTVDNFRQLFSKPDTWRVIGNTLFYVSMTLAFNVLVGLFLAITTFYLPKSGNSFFSLLWLLPRITPVVLYAVLWRWFTWDTGFLPTLASHLGLPSFNYMKGSVPTAWATVILLNGFIGASFGMILFSGALRAIPMQQLWASEVDGAARWQQIRYIILPHLRWPILFITSYQTLSLLTSYQEIWLTTNGGPGNTTTVWALEAFRVALFSYSGNLQYGLGAAMAVIMVLIGLVLSTLYLRLFRFDSLVDRPKIEF